MNKLLPYILIAIAAVAGLLLNQYLNPSEKQANSAVADQGNGNRIDNRFETLLIYPKKNRLPAFQFVNQDNHSFSNENFLERWNLIFIGYTNVSPQEHRELPPRSQFAEMLTEIRAFAYRKSLRHWKCKWLSIVY